ncbi:hypothetical protein SADUNF_Sadunf16G0288700 [Salix dunnii]|uniref:25S rRNA (uridine-N(3))-methyltransferase BMT5-like domain-containing protein n=1 Tax=Salix dunnii TaxID=1413687 RepID=A0A835MRK0_9ROSI|nr:hypothetical protein SADUNF_Sadunf16G0288700 [Salix dunnii]
MLAKRVQWKAFGSAASMVATSLDSKAMEGLERQMEILGIKNKEKWIKQYTSSHKLLLVGEGDFSSAACLGKAFGSAVSTVATSLYSEEETMMQKYSKGATKLKRA